MNYLNETLGFAEGFGERGIVSKWTLAGLGI